MNIWGMEVEKGETINAGELVICDFCNEDGDQLNDEGTPKFMGGGLVGSYALCPPCFAKIDKTEEPESILEFDQTRSFGDNVRAYRLRSYGTTDCLIEFYYPKGAEDGDPASKLDQDQ